MKEPIAKQIPHIHEMHGDRREDPYYWLRERDHEDVTSYLNEENAYREGLMAPLQTLESTLYDEMVSRIVPDDWSVPVRIDDFWYQTRFNKGAEYPCFYRREGAEDGPEICVLDVPKLAEGQAFCSVSGIFLSEDHRLMGYGVDFVSRRQYLLRFVDLDTGASLSLEIPNTTGSMAWAKDGQTIFYATKDEVTLRVDKIWRQHLRDGSGPVLVYHERDEAFSCGVSKSKSKDFIVVSSGATDVSEMHTIPADQPAADPQCFMARQAGHEYSASHYDGQWFILSNKEGRDNFALFTAQDDQRDAWQEIIPHREHVALESMTLFRDHLVTVEREQGLLSIQIRNHSGSVDHSVDMDESTYTLATGSNPMADTEVLRFVYTSMTTPSTVYDYNMSTRDRVIKKQAEIPGGYDASQYVTKRLWAKGADGRDIPMSYVGPADAQGPIPTLLYGYGSYGITIDPSFSRTRLSLLERGMAFVIAHIRGSEYLGREWYDLGKMEHKQNTFSDFIACGEFLRQEGLASELYAMGGSAGGLLMGAVMNQAPQLWDGIIAAVPFVDVLTTMLDESIPLTTGEYNEWGNPNEEVAYRRMKAYSPYDQVVAQDYPPTLITTGLHDSQVQYWEPAKWIARLRERRTNRAPLMMYCNMDTGHGGASGRYAALKETAMEYAFILGLKEGLLK